MSKVGAIVGIVGIVLAAIAFVGPWWTVNIDANVPVPPITVKGVADFRLFGGTATTTTTGLPGGTLTISNSTDYSGDPATRSTFLVGAALTGVGLAFGAVTVALTFASKGNPRLRKIGAIIGILGFVLTLVAPLYVMARLPSAVNEDGASGGPQISGFWGSQTFSLGGVNANATWGAGWAWFLVIVAAVMFLIAGIMALRGARSTMAASPQGSEMPQ